MKRPTITYIIDNLKVGGAQVHLINLVNRIYKSHNVNLVSLGEISNSIAGRLHPSVNIFELKMNSILR